MTTSTSAGTTGFLLYCRPGFEKECAAEIQEHAGFAGLAGYSKAGAGTGFVVYRTHPAAGPEVERASVRYADLIFARQKVLNPVLLGELPDTDRITPILEQARLAHPCYSAVWLETADTNAAKELGAFTRKFRTPFVRAAEKAGVSGSAIAAPRLHVFFLSATSVYLGYSWPDDSAPWPMGIPRLKFPRGAPSRSTLKLEEAFLSLLSDPERLPAPGMTAVDLGAAPGGWTWQLVRRHLRVYAVDNGALQRELLESGLVEHIRADAFRYRPPKPVDWMVCDVVERPSRIAALVARWISEGWCRQSIFNLKLPMKRRYEEVKRCRQIIGAALEQACIRHDIRFKQLYHDREEVTGWLRRFGRP